MPQVSGGSYTDLQAALDEVEGHDSRVCDATTQDSPKTAQGVVLRRTKLTAHVRVCGKGDTRVQHAVSHTLGLQNSGNFPVNFPWEFSWNISKIPQPNFPWNGNFLESFQKFSAPRHAIGSQWAASC